MRIVLEDPSGTPEPDYRLVRLVLRAISWFDLLSQRARSPRSGIWPKPRDATSRLSAIESGWHFWHRTLLKPF